MLSVSSSIKFSLKAAAIAAFSIGCAQAVVVPYLGVQGPNPDPFTAPTLQGTALTQSNAFFAKADLLGHQEFEGATQATLGFNYTGGSASFVAGPGGMPTPLGPQPAVLPKLWSDQDNAFDPTVGRYNVTQGLAAGAAGKWVEAYSDFTVTFTGGVTALSFFVTDLGDFDGQVFIDLYNGDQILSTTQLLNAEVAVDAQGNVLKDQMGRAIANGNLLFFGATSDTVDFTKAVFRIKQLVNDSGQVTNIDYIGVDSLWVGQYNGSTTGGNVPEPASLALVGLALAAGGLSRRRTKR